MLTKLSIRNFKRFKNVEIELGNPEKGDNSREMQEERRNCFVAITRVQKSLTLTYPHEVSGRTKGPSRFLREMGFSELRDSDLDQNQP